MDDTLRRWLEKSGLAFVDAYLASLAARHRCAIDTRNVRE
jgi:hypothetical protein